MKRISLLLLLFCAFWAYGQNNVGLGTTNPDPSAALEIKSTDQGLLIPRMDSTSRLAILSPATGLLVFDSSSNSFWYYNGTAWQNLAGSDAQMLTLLGDTLQIGNGNYVVLQDNVNDADSDPTNEIQNLTLNGDTLSLSGGDYVLLPSGTIDTDQQTLALNGDTLSIANGNSVVLPVSDFGSAVQVRDSCFMESHQDAFNTGSGNYPIDSPSGPSGWQSFTALSDGYLTQVQAYSGTFGGGDFKVYSGTGTSGTLLYSSTPGNLGNGWITFPIPYGTVPVGSGSTYTIFLEETLGNLSWLYEEGNSYNGGTANTGPYDFLFKTQVSTCSTRPVLVLQDIDTLFFADNTYQTTAATDDQALSLSNDTLSIEDGNALDLSAYLDNTDSQTLNITNDSLSIAQGNKVDLSAYLDNTDNQSITLNGDSLTISGGNAIDLSSIDNQTLAFSNDSLSIANGNKVDLSAYLDNTDSQTLSLSGDTLGIENGNSIVLSDQVEDADADPTNELQVLSLSNDTLYLSGGGFAVLSMPDTLSILADADNDTKIQVEKNPDEDVIRFEIEGQNALTIEQNAAGFTLINPPGTNVFYGQNAGLSTSDTAGLSSGFGNTFIGASAGNKNVSGYRNTSIGFVAGLENISGIENTYIGGNTGNQNKGDYNVFLGSGAGSFNTGGSSNTIVGHDAGYATFGGSGNIFLGRKAGYFESGHNKLYISNSDTASPLIYGEFDNALLRFNGDVEVEGVLQIADGTQANGLVLTSDADGNASWQTSAATLIPSVFDTLNGVVLSGSAVTMGSDDFVFGSPQLDDDGNSIHDARMLFDKSKAAFRVGSVNNADWDDGNRGNHSFASGYRTKANGNYSTAMGANTKASGDYSISMGYFTTASSFSSSALGFNTTASGSSSTATGYLTTASGAYSTSMGYNTQATGESSIALGRASSANGARSTVIGSQSNADADFSMAFGQAVNTQGQASVAMGRGTKAFSAGEIALGSYNTEYVANDSVNWNAKDRALAIGNGEDNSNRSDAMVILKNGNTGFGTSTPDTTFHLVGKMKYQDGTQANGLVLTSDTDGNASWQAVSVPSTATVFDTLNGVVLPGSAVTVASDDFVFGSPQLAEDGNTAHKSRFFFDKSKAAFRAGQSDLNSWSESNTGSYSVAFGEGTKASGSGAAAFGSASTASGAQSTVFGSYNLASGQQASAIGSHAYADGNRSAAIGYYAEAYSFAEMAFGTYNSVYSPASTGSFNLSDRLFVIGNGTSNVNRSDAMVILKNGNTGFGTSAPDTTLHIVGKMKYQDGTQGATKVLTSDANGNASWQSSVQTTLTDADNDTKIHLEKSADEDIIRFDIGGTESHYFKQDKLSFQPDNNLQPSIQSIEFNARINGDQSSIKAVFPDFFPTPASRDFKLNFHVKNLITPPLSIRGDGTLRINDAYTLPNGDGPGNRSLTTDGSGNVNWGGPLAGDSTVKSFDGDQEIVMRNNAAGNYVQFDVGGPSGHHQDTIYIGDKNTNANKVVMNGPVEMNHNASVRGNATVGGLKVGSGGTVLAEIIKVSVNYNVPTVVGNGGHIATFTVNGATPGSAVYVAPDRDLTGSVLIAYAWVAAANEVSIRWRNTQNVNDNPVDANYFVTVIK